MKARLLLAVFATALLCMTVLPSANAQQVGITNPQASTPTTLYFHLIDVQDFPINTQKPDDRFTDSTSWGTNTHSLTCVPNPNDLIGQGGAPFQDFHTYYGYSSPSYVEYDFEQDGKPRTHPERGISYDAVLDQSAPFTVYWYMATQAMGAPTSLPANPDQAPVILPNVVVQATMRASDAISVDDTAYNNGPLIAEGKTAPATLAAGSAYGADGQPAVQTRWVGKTETGADLYEFAVPMTYSNPLIPRATGYNLRVTMFMEDPAGQCAEEDKLMANGVKIHTDAQNRPRMELSVMDPIRLEYLHPQFVGDDLVIHTSMNAVWGNYDVNEEDPDGITVSVEGPSPATSLVKAAMVQRTHEHYHHQEAVDITYVWPYKTDRAANGLYTVTVSFMNDQRTATALGVAQFEIGKGTVIGCGGVQQAAGRISDDCAQDVQADGVTQKESPGVELLGVLGILAAALVVARRRNK